MFNRLANQANISITTNRSCTLRCEHCYIEPHLFNSKERMSVDLYRHTFEKVDLLYEIDIGLEEVEWEVIGGETTMMPFDFWEQNLSWTLERIARFNKEHDLWIEGNLNFLTNLIWADKRYLGLLQEYASHDLFTLYTSFEPDTNRFGKNNKLLNTWCDRLEKIDARNKAVDLILTKGLIEFGAQRTLDLLLPLGVDDLSIKMLSPFGSGKEFFKDNMTDFQSMEDFVLEIDSLIPSNVTYTPGVEIEHSLRTGKSVQCNGNFRYDISIEPDGMTQFNANQTGSESIGLDLNININDEDWAHKVLFGNRDELRIKLAQQHSLCEQCKYLPRCNGGWHHYKNMDISKYLCNGSCPGLFGVWERFDNGGSIPEWSSTKRNII